MLYSLPSLVQTAFAEIASNVSTSSTSYVDLLTCNITTSVANPLEIHFTACVDATAAMNAAFQLMVDGVAITGIRGRITAAANPAHNSCPALRYKTGALAAGAHVIKVQWKTLTAFTAVSIRPANFIYAHGSLLVREVTV